MHIMRCWTSIWKILFCRDRRDLSAASYLSDVGLQRFIRALTVNVRRYLASGSAFNANLAPGSAANLFYHVSSVWAGALCSTPLAGMGRLIDASLQGTPPVALPAIGAHTITRLVSPQNRA